MWIGQLVRRLRFLLGKENHLEDLEAEMRLHRELRAQQLQGDGAPQADAVFAANRKFGNATVLKERSKDMWGWNWLEDLGKDLRYVCRNLQSNLLFASITVLTIALGIGANTAIFSVINAALLRTLPVHDPYQLVHLRVLPNQPNGAGNTGDSDSSFSEYVFEQLRKERQVFSDLAAYVPASNNKTAIRVGNAPQEAIVDLVSGNFFSGLGVHAVCGRTLTVADETQHSAVAIVSGGFGNRQFGEACSALGKILYVKSVPFTIAGVAESSFSGLESSPTDIWIPLQNRPELNAWGSAGKSFYAEPNWWCLRLIGRLSTGVTEAQAQAKLAPVFQHAAYEHLGGKPKIGEKAPTLAFAPVRGIGQKPEGVKEPLQILMAMVGLILVIACGNVAMLLLARNAARQREFSIRLAIGGSQIRLFRQLLAESLVLVAAGASLGWLFALLATRALAAWSESEFSLAPDGRVLLFTVAISVIVGIIFGLAPLFTATRIPISLALKNSAATAFQDGGKSKAGRTVVALQIALCLTLTIGAGLLIGTLRNLEHMNLGLRAHGLLVFGIAPQFKTRSDAQTIRFYTALFNRLRATPGIESVTLTSNRIGSGWSNNTDALVDGKYPRANSATVSSNLMRWNAVGSDYLKTLGVPILQGRDFTDADSSSGSKVAIVSQTFAQRFLPGRAVLGHQVSFNSKFAYTIVGVAGNSKYTAVREQDVPMAYFPFTQLEEVGDMNVEMRTAGNPIGFLPQVRKTVAAFAPDLALLQPITQEAQFDSTISEERLLARLSVFFGILAALLVATGLYGTLAYSVNRRTSEFGVRMAIGAQRSGILWIILRESFAICSVGILIGIPLAFVATRLLSSLLYGLTPNDPLILCLATISIAIVCLFAGLIPASRAASVDPNIALRYE